MPKTLDFVVGLIDKNGVGHDIEVSMDRDDLDRRHHSFQGRISLASAIAWTAQGRVAKMQSSGPAVYPGSIGVTSIRQVVPDKNNKRYNVLLREDLPDARTVSVAAASETEAQFLGAWKVAFEEMGSLATHDIKSVLNYMINLYPLVIGPSAPADMQSLLVELFNAVESGNDLDEVKDKVRSALDELGLLESSRPRM